MKKRFKELKREWEHPDCWEIGVGKALSCLVEIERLEKEKKQEEIFAMELADKIEQLTAIVEKAKETERRLRDFFRADSPEIR